MELKMYSTGPDTRRSCTGPFYQIVLVKPCGRFYQGKAYLATAEDPEEAERQYENPVYKTLPEWRQPKPVAGVGLVVWNPKHERWDVVKQREARPGEFEEVADDSGY
jgi:hypothetical protein